MKNLFAGLAGLIFGLGLIVGGMVNPAKVLAFLDVTGLWDPSLAFVMGGALAVASLGFYLLRGRAHSLLGLPIQLPKKSPIDRPLVVGSLLFGAGWGLAGICPGPALVLVGSGVPAGLIFVAAMLAGMALYEWLLKAH